MPGSIRPSRCTAGAFRIMIVLSGTSEIEFIGDQGEEILGFNLKVNGLLADWVSF